MTVAGVSPVVAYSVTALSSSPQSCTQLVIMQPYCSFGVPLLLIRKYKRQY